MKVQTRLSLFSSFVFGIIFIIISLFIYALYYYNAEKSIYKNLRKTSYITAIFYLEEDELNIEDFSKAKKQFEEFVTNSFYQVYNEENQVRYGTVAFPVAAELLDKIREKEELSYKEDDFFLLWYFL
ncbi:MAG: hypothetical protein LIO65_06300 [Odoribacter sp.]|nr:hypothetical protein [Odoribacter sp.]